MFPTFAVRMKKLLFVFFLVVSLFATSIDATAQCSICTRTAEQLGEKIDEAGNEARDEIDDATDEIKDKVEDACEETTDENC